MGRAALGEFGVVGEIPGAVRKLQGLALFVAPHIAPENIDGVGGPRLVFSSGQPVEFVGEFIGILTLGMGSSGRYLDWFFLY